jgi:tRNA (guanine-N7-)-methyltransferase
MTSTEIRTYKPRRGRFGVQRREALRRLWPEYGVEVTGGAVDAVALFGRRAPVVLEIGSGMGEATAALAAADPGRDYLAAEVHTPGVANLLALIEAGGLTNVRVVHGDALELLRDRLAPASLDAVHAFFPDPWPKVRHHKRRLFQPGRVALLRSRLVRGGTIHTATDWPDYAVAMRAALAGDPDLELASEGRQAGRPETGYERRALDEGREVFELVFRRY